MVNTKHALYLIVVAILILTIYVVANLDSIRVTEAIQEQGMLVEQQHPETKNPKTEQLIENCQPKSFWEKYDIWGDTSTIYKPSSENDVTSETQDEHSNCVEPAKLIK